MRTKRKFSIEEKLQILNEASLNGIMETCRKYNISHTLFDLWRRKNNAGGSKALNRIPKKPLIDPEQKRLEQENERLKRIIGDMQLELDVKNSLLKKTLLRNKTK